LLSQFYSYIRISRNADFDSPFLVVLHLVQRIALEGACLSMSSWRRALLSASWALIFRDGGPCAAGGEEEEDAARSGLIELSFNLSLASVTKAGSTRSSGPLRLENVLSSDLLIRQLAHAVAPQHGKMQHIRQGNLR
jgi:hypothetical protein